MLEILNINGVIKAEKLQRVNDSLSFIKTEINPSGLYSTLIFGNSTQEKFEKFGYIDLGSTIIHPVIRKNLNKLGSIFFNVTLDSNNPKAKKCIIKDGVLTEDENGQGGISFLIENWDKIDLNKVRKDSNTKFIDTIQEHREHIFINKFLVIPVNYRQYVQENGKLNEDEITGMYKQILTINKNSASLSGNTFIDNMIEIGGGKITSVQKIVDDIYKYFIDLNSGKSGVIRDKVIGKRVDNITRLVANAQPNIPMDSVAIPWQNLLVMFDLFVINILRTKSNDFMKSIGMEDFSFDDFGPHFDFIFRHSDSYTQMYPQRQQIWVDILLEVFNRYQDLRVMLKRDPAWDKNSFHCLKPIIIKDISYHCVVNSLLYKPLGGDSFNTDYLGIIKDGPIYENDKFIIRGDNDINIKITSTKALVDSIKAVKWEH